MAKKIIDYEKQFQTQDDARTLAKYQELMSDKKRMESAMKEARKQAAEYQKKADAYSYACGGKLKKKK